MKIKDITNYLESFAPLSLQESYDNSGLITGNPNDDVTNVLITLDTIEEIIDEAINKNANLIISHHPIVFKGLKSLTGKNYVELTVIKAIKNDIAIYAAHTNFDNINLGVNRKICKKIGLINCRILSPSNELLRKIVTFVPKSHVEKVRQAIFDAGAGQIGNYDYCSYNTEGTGTYRAGKNTNPFKGEKNKLHFEKEIRIETIFPAYLQNKIINKLIETHPYEEVAYDIYKLENNFENVGAGMFGELENAENELVFLKKIKKIFKTEVIKHTKLLGKSIKKVAICGGAGSFLAKNAISANADIFISGDFKYHEFFDAENKIIFADIGHFESEQYTKELFYEILTKKFNTFACYLSEINTNPIKYL